MDRVQWQTLMLAVLDLLLLVAHNVSVASKQLISRQDESSYFRYKAYISGGRLFFS
jgi:hypothetical protein